MARDSESRAVAEIRRSIDQLIAGARVPVEFLPAGDLDTDNALCLEIAGDSMEPTLRPGDAVLIDTKQQDPSLRDGLYGLVCDGEIQVKRLASHPATGRITISSDNRLYSAWPDLSPDDLQIVGRVIWIGRRL